MVLKFCGHMAQNHSKTLKEPEWTPKNPSIWTHSFSFQIFSNRVSAKVDHVIHKIDFCLPKCESKFPRLNHACFAWVLNDSWFFRLGEKRTYRNSEVPLLDSRPLCFWRILIHAQLVCLSKRWNTDYPSPGYSFKSFPCQPKPKAGHATYGRIWCFQPFPNTLKQANRHSQEGTERKSWVKTPNRKPTDLSDRLFKVLQVTKGGAKEGDQKGILRQRDSARSFECWKTPSHNVLQFYTCSSPHYHCPTGLGLTGTAQMDLWKLR